MPRRRSLRPLASAPLVAAAVSSALDWYDAQIDDMIHNIGVASRVALAGMSPEEAELRNVIPVDERKFDALGRPDAA